MKKIEENRRKNRLKYQNIISVYVNISVVSVLDSFTIILRFSKFKLLIYVVSSVVVLILVGVGAYRGIKVGDLENASYDRYYCEISSDLNRGEEKSSIDKAKQNNKVFRILELEYRTKNLANSLCKDKSFSEYYNSVEVVWKYAEDLDIGEIFDKEYDLILSKDVNIHRTNLEENTGYSPIAKFPNYASFFISLDSSPQLTNEYFSGKKIGLIDDTSSDTGYQIPRKAIKSNGLDESLFEIILYESWFHLYKALKKGEVDIIGSFLPILRSENATGNPNLILARNLTGINWYLEQSLLDTKAHCQVEKSLLGYAKETDLYYTRALSITRSCRL